MGTAITARSATATRQRRDRLNAIFIEAPQELSAEDPRRALVTDPDIPTFLGFDEASSQSTRRQPPRR